MIHSFFNPNIRSEDYSLENFAHRCFIPVRYLFQGRAVEAVNQTILESQTSFEIRDWKTTALMIALFIPGLIAGIAIKTFSYFFASTKLKDGLASSIRKKNFPPAIVQESPATPLENSHKKLEKWKENLLVKMTSKQIWKDENFIEEISAFMEAAYQEIVILYEQLAEKHDRNPNVMAKRMIVQSLFGMSEEDIEADSSIYSFPYFYDSLTEVYHLARSCAYVENVPKRGKVFKFPPLTREDQEPYFDPEKPQYLWRTAYYNPFCNKLDEYELRDKLQDGRFANWSNPDDDFVQSYGFPDTRPTRSLSTI